METRRFRLTMWSSRGSTVAQLKKGERFSETDSDYISVQLVKINVFCQSDTFENVSVTLETQLKSKNTSNRHSWLGSASPSTALQSSKSPKSIRLDTKSNHDVIHDLSWIVVAISPFEAKHIGIENWLVRFSTRFEQILCKINKNKF